jgi:hypothetical protein
MERSQIPKLPQTKAKSGAKANVEMEFAGRPETCQRECSIEVVGKRLSGSA